MEKKLNMNSFLKYLTVSLLTASISCSKDGGKDFANLDVGGGANDPCTISGKIPDTETLKVAAASSSVNQFVTQTSNDSCTITYTVNGAEVTSTAGVAEINSSSFLPGTNKVKVLVSNAKGSESFEWTVKKNQPPTCNSQIPSNLSPNVAAGSDLTMTVNGADADSDNLEFTWKYNGSENPTLLTPIINSSSASQISFRPQPANGGTNTIAVGITDGYDTATCSWNVSVTGDCSLTSFSPNVTGNNVRILSIGTTQNTFQVATATAGCAVTWNLNGAPLSGNDTIRVMNSSLFSTGNNILSATVSNASGQSSQTWNVVKNSAPTCGTMTPLNTTTQTIGIASNLNLSLTAGDTNSDPLSFAWKLNGSAVATTILATSATGNTAAGVFTPASGQVGANSISVEVNDGYETSTCSWPVQVLPSCDITSSSPDHNVSQRIASTSLQTKAFSVIPNYPTYCSVTWYVNGTNVGTGSLYNLLSTNSLISAGSAHTVMAEVSNGSGSTVTRTWNIAKNNAPSCASFNPASTTMAMSEGATQNFTGTLTDTDSDPLTFAWKLNGATNSHLTLLGNLTSSSTAQFTPDISNVGTNTVALEVNDGFDAVTCSWNVTVNGNCTLSGNAPSNVSPIKISNSGIGYIYTISTSTAGCPVNWSINGFPISGTDAIKSFNSSDFSPGNNNLVASVSNGSTTTSVTWNIRRNNLPTAVQTPSASGVQNLSINSSYNFQANVTDVDADSLSASWRLDGQVVSTAIVNPVSASNPFVAAFAPTNSYTGGRTLTVFVSDGTDTVEYQWDAMIYNNCTVASAFPSATQRISVQNNVTTTYGVIPNDSSCAVTWKLNGTTVGTGNLYNLSSLNGSLGSSNEVKAILDNGVGTPTETTWSVVKNEPPVCLAGQTPAATGNEMDYTANMTFSATTSDSEGDPLTYAWRLNNNYPELFDNIGGTTYSTTARLNPTFSVLGAGQVVTSTFNDGWDAGMCSWNVTIRDPARVEIQACSPSQGAQFLLSKVSTAPVKYDIKTFTVSADGPGTLAYKWYEDGTEITGETNPQLLVSTSMTDTSTSETPDHLWAVGTRELKVEVTDQYNNTESCIWQLKRNRPPTINTAAAGTNSTGVLAALDGVNLDHNASLKMNYSSTLQLTIHGSDLDTLDANNLLYYWKINNQQLPTSGNSLLSYTVAGNKLSSTATITPNYDFDLLGNHTVTAVVSDGYETAEFTWNLGINMFSKQCNTLYNSPVSSRGGQICTIIGQAGVGGDRTPATEQSRLRMQVSNVTFDGNNMIIVDAASHSIFYYNRGTSASDNVERFGMTGSSAITFGKIVPILGIGGDGITPNKGSKSDPFKLNNPRAAAYFNNRLYIADTSNNRVVMLDENGIATSFIGRISDGSLPTNAAAANSTTLATGTSQYCNSPWDVKVRTEGPTTYLYVACGLSIKRAVISAGSDYGKVQLVVGKVDASGAASQGFENGDPLTQARTANPRAMDFDDDGNLYWTEREGLLRVWNRSGATKTFFPGGTTASATTVNVSEFANTGGLGAGSAGSKLESLNANLNAPDRFAVTSIGTAGVNQCIPVVVQVYNSSNKAANVSSSTTVTLGVTGGVLKTDSTCGTNLPSSQVTIPAGFHFAEAWVQMSATAGTSSVVTVSSNSGGLTNGASATITNGTPGTANKYVVQALGNHHIDDCTRVWVAVTDSSNRIIPNGTQSIRFRAQNGGTFYASNDPTCAGNPIDGLTFDGTANAYKSGFIYYARKYKVADNKVATIFGNPASVGAVTESTYGPIGTTSQRQGEGFAVNYDGSNVLGFFFTNYDRDVLTYVNNVDVNGVTTATQVVGGYTFGTNSATMGTYHEHRVVGGLHDSAAFNGDTKLGINARLNVPRGIAFDPSRDYLYVGDLNNWRLRRLKVTSGSGQGVLSSELGIGRARWGWYGDAAMPAEDATFDFPGDILFDSAENSMLISDTRNGRIRKVDLTKGSFETIIGRGRGTMTVPAEDRFAMNLGGPQQMAIAKDGSKDFLVFTDSQTLSNWEAVGANKTCAMRAYNRSPSQITSILGEDVLPGNVADIVGDYTIGCTDQNSIAFGSNGLLSGLGGPMGLAYDGANFFVSDFINHCILKISSTNVVSNFIGSCGNPGLSDGIGDSNNASNPTRSNKPTSIVMDPLNPGNFFFLDNWNNNTGKIRYANTGTSSVYFPVLASDYAEGKGSGDVRVTSLWNFAPNSTTSRLNGIAAFGNYVCVTSGGSDGTNNTITTGSNVGAHGVYCFDRTDDSGSASRRAGSLDSTATRGGMSLGLEQELIPGRDARMNMPFGIAFDSDGNLYVVERGSNSVTMIRRWW